MKKLIKSNTNKVVAGVLGGIGEYADIDPVLIRLIYLLVTLVTGVVPGLIVYLVAMLIIPDAPVITPSEPTQAHDDSAV